MADSGTLCDGLSTALFVMGREKALDFWRQEGGFEAVLVEDSGEGIAPEDLPHIFERFYKGKNAGKDSVGIGLAMAKYILGIQNGQIEAFSEPGKGSRFVFWLYHLVV